MKLVMDEKLKHRLIGLAVILSVAAIFLPAVMKKSSQRLDHKLSVTIKLPKKPVEPNVVLTDKKEVFKTVKVAQVEIQPVSELVKVEPVQLDAGHGKRIVNVVDVEQETKLAPVHLAFDKSVNARAEKIIKTAATQSVKQAIPGQPLINVASKEKIAPKIVASIQAKKVASLGLKKQSLRVTKKPVRGIYAVQLASFSQRTNAQALVNKLRVKGYKANFVKASSKRGTIVYKVYVGHSPLKQEVMKLKTQLASAMQLNGFVVNTGIS